jgi:hypothetical protein
LASDLLPTPHHASTHRRPGRRQARALLQSRRPSGAATGEDALKIRALLVDGVLKEWTTGDAHDVTDRSFVVRRVIRLNDALPSDKPGPSDKASHWVWQRGPWLLVDRTTGRVTALSSCPTTIPA